MPFGLAEASSGRIQLRHGTAWHGMARHGTAWHGTAWHGMARHGKPWQGEAEATGLGVAEKEHVKVQWDGVDPFPPVI